VKGGTYKVHELCRCVCIYYNNDAKRKFGITQAQKRLCSVVLYICITFQVKICDRKKIRARHEVRSLGQPMFNKIKESNTCERQVKNNKNNMRSMLKYHRDKIMWNQTRNIECVASS